MSQEPELLLAGVSTNSWAPPGVGDLALSSRDRPALVAHEFWIWWHLCCRSRIDGLEVIREGGNSPVAVRSE